MSDMYQCFVMWGGIALFLGAMCWCNRNYYHGPDKERF